jgi:hypothetical protein
MLLLHADNELQKDTAGIKSKISFLPFYNFIKAKSAQVQGRKTLYLDYVISRFEQEPAMLAPIEDPALLTTHEDLLELVASAIFPATTDEHTTFYSFSAPYIFQTFYYSDLFGLYFTREIDGTRHLSFPDDVSLEKIKQENLSLAYKFILKKFYNFDLNVNADLVYHVNDPFTGQRRYGKVMADDRFVDVELTGELPEFKMTSICPKTYRIIDCDKLQAELPLSNFIFHGFLVRHIVDITSTAFADEIKNAILSAGSSHDMEVYQKLTGSIKGMIELNDIDVDLIPVISINNETEMPKKYEGGNKLLLEICGSENAQERYKAFAAHFEETGQPLLLYDIKAQAAMYNLPFLEKLTGTEGSLLLMPIFSDNKLVGVVQLHSEKANIINFAVQNKLALAYPLLVMAFEKYHDKLEQDINEVMKNEFTAIQPTVEWKFIEVAWEYIQNKLTGSDKPLAPILFKEVYPIYGAVDIRNSSVERAHAINKDLGAQLELTETTFARLQSLARLPILDGFQFRLQQLRERLEGDPGSELESEITDFIEGDIRAAFRHFAEVDDTAAAMVKNYYFQVANTEGPLHTNRHAFDQSLSRINKTVAKILDAQEITIQQSFPHYFEKYRSDGIEYNIYIGQSLAPKKKFDWIYLKNLRLWQLGAMADIALATHQLEEQLPHPLRTTQLILAHHHPIDISFRKDERKFDVEGAYNIRYEVVKKRLDKALVKDTGERLTQPGKIAIVYTHASEADEYLQYVQYLQHTGQLLPGHELLDIDNLQGVSGLKAIRVSVNFEKGKI